MSDNLPSLPDLNRLAPFVEGLGKSILREMIEDLSAIEADRVSRDVPAGWRDLLISLTEHAAEAGDHTDESFRRGVVHLANRAHKFLAASPQPQPVQAQPSEAATLAIEALEAAKNGLEWYRTEYPEQVNGCDDEMDQQIEAAIAALQGKPAEQAHKEE